MIADERFIVLFLVAEGVFVLSGTVFTCMRVELPCDCAPCGQCSIHLCTS